MKRSRYRFALSLLALFLVLGLAACDAGPGAEEEEEERPAESGVISPDDLRLVRVDPVYREILDTPDFDLLFENTSETKVITGLLINFRAVVRSEGGAETVIDEAELARTVRIGPGQQGVGTATFFEIESHDAYDCYRYTVSVIGTGTISLRAKDYAGTCGA